MLATVSPEAKEKLAENNRAIEQKDLAKPQAPRRQAEFYRASSKNRVGPGKSNAAVTPGSDGKVSFNFVDTPINEVVSIVLGDTLKVDYIIDPNVQGTVTIRTGRPIATDAVMTILEDALALAGVALIPEDKHFVVIPFSGARNSSGRSVRMARRGKLDLGFGLHVMPLKFASATQLVKLLRGFVAPERALHADGVRNILLYSGTSSEAADMFELIEFFDADWMAGTSYAILPVETADAKKIIEELEVIFEIDGAKGNSTPVRLLPIERMNAVLAITTQPAYLQRLKIWVERLDRGEDSEAQRVYVYRVQHGRAKELADVIAELINTSDRQRSVNREVTRNLTSLPGPAPLPVRSSDVKPSAPAPKDDKKPSPRERAKNRSVSAKFDSTVFVVGGSNPPTVIAHEATNALLILATPAQYRMIEDTLKRLDTIPLQVMIEATIAEVTLNDELKFGIEWFFARGDLQGGFVANPLGNIGLTFPGFSLLFNDGDRLAALSALAKVTDVNVISSPQLMVLNNQSASLQVGDQVPIATQSSVSSTDSLAPTVNTIVYRDTGVVLEVTPRVNANGYISVDISQEVSDVTPTSTSDIDSPTIQQRKIKTTIAMRTGQTVALGGLIRDNENAVESGIPFLMDIPILGHLFKTTSNVRFRTELLVLLTMHIIRDPEDSRLIMKDLRERFRSIRPLERKIGRKLLN